MSDAARLLFVEKDLVRAAFEYLTVDAFMALPFEALAPTKALLKRFFSLEPWTREDDGALAAAVGPGEGKWEQPLDDDLTLSYGWGDGVFSVRVTFSAEAGNGAFEEPLDQPPIGVAEGGRPRRVAERAALATSFDGPVVPEATPNPRTIRFQVGSIHSGASRWYEAAAAAQDDPGASRLFAEFEQVANVLIGPDFVAVGVRRPSDWEDLLLPVLAVVTEEFAADDRDDEAEDEEEPARRVMGGPAGAGAGAVGAPLIGSEDAGHTGKRRVSRLERAWQEMGSLRPAQPADLAEVRAAAAGDDPARRQVAASLLREADPEVALVFWTRLVSDRVRSVRRAVVDAIVDVCREDLRPLLEGALDDADAWVRWKAMRGLAELGPARSRAAIAARAEDPDFRVRLEAAAALRSTLELQ